MRAAIWATRPDLAGSTIQLGGLSQSPQDMAAIIGRAVGLHLRFHQLPIDRFIAKGDAASGPARMGSAIGALYAWALSRPCAPADVGTAGLETLGAVPMATERWAEAQSWAREFEH